MTGISDVRSEVPPECDCRRPTTPDGIYHESTCSLRLTERDRDYKAEVERLREAIRETQTRALSMAEMRLSGASR